MLTQSSAQVGVGGKIYVESICPSYISISTPPFLYDIICHVSVWLIVPWSLWSRRPTQIDHSDSDTDSGGQS
jgi:hypothetical protein